MLDGVQSFGWEDVVVPLYSRKLHMRVLRARTRAETSLVILAFSFGDRVVNHLQRRCGGVVLALDLWSYPMDGVELTTLPWRERRMMYLAHKYSLLVLEIWNKRFRLPDGHYGILEILNPTKICIKREINSCSFDGCLTAPRRCLTFRPDLIRLICG